MKAFCEFCSSEDVLLVLQRVKKEQWWWIYCNKCGIEVKWLGNPNDSDILWIGDINMKQITRDQAKQHVHYKLNPEFNLEFF